LELLIRIRLYFQKAVEFKLDYIHFISAFTSETLKSFNTMTHPFVNIHKKRLVQLMRTKILPGTFSEVIGAHTSTMTFDKNLISFNFKVSESLCRSSGGSPYLSVASIISLFDDFSSYSFMMKDKSSRPGVSVLLSVESMVDCYAGDEVYMKCDTVKIGKNLGYCNMELCNTTGQVLARGNHIKYLPAGFLYEILCNTSVLPISLGLYNILDRSILGTKIFPGSKALPTPYPFHGVASVFEALKLKEIEDTIPSKTDCGQSNISSFQLPMQQIIRNGNGSVHGGAVAMAAEQCTTLSSPGQCDRYVL
jgi:hypothetical protein